MRAGVLLKLMEEFERWLNHPARLYGYVWIKTLVLIALLLALSGRGGESVIYVGF